MEVGVASLILDIDGTAGDFIGYEGGQMDVGMQCQLMMRLDRMHREHGVRVCFITDKPAGQLPTFAGALVPRARGRFHFGESGGARFDVATYEEVINPDYREFVETSRHELKRALQAAGLWRSEPGAKRVSITIVNHKAFMMDADARKVAGRDFHARVMAAVQTTAAQPLVRVRAGEDGNIVTIMPAKLTKRDAVVWLMQSYADIGAPVNPARSIWVGDGDSDRDAAETFQEYGVKTCCVGNATQRLKEFVRDTGGFCAENPVQAGLLEVLDHYERTMLLFTDRTRQTSTPSLVL